MKVIKDNMIKARKIHRCNLCGKLIPKGDNYYCQTNVEDGDIYNFKECLKCHKIVEDNIEYFRDGYEHLIDRETFEELLKELELKDIK